MARLKKVAVLAVVASSALMLSPSRASAGFLSGSTGNTLMRDTPSRSGVVSFTVFQTSGPTANWVNELNAALTAMGSAPVTASFLGASDTNAAYVYMYQVVNVSTANGKIDAFAVADYGGYTSAGYFTDRVFKDAQGAVEGSAGNNNYALGPDPPFTGSTTGDDMVNGVPTNQGPYLTGFAGPLTGNDATNTIEPNSFTTTTGDPTLNVPAFATFNFPSPGRVGKDQWSSIIFLTSDIAPTYWAGRVTDGNYSDGDVPVAVTPEPGTLLMIVIGVAGLSGSYGWRRWRTGPAASPALTAA